MQCYESKLLKFSTESKPLLMSTQTIAVWGVAGLGNRMLSLAFALEIAKKQRRVVVVDWSDGRIGPVGMDLFGDFFEVQDAEVMTMVTGRDAEMDYHPIFLYKNNSLGRMLRRLSSGRTLWLLKSPIRKKGRRIILPIDIQNPFRKRLICLEYQPQGHRFHEVRQIQLRDRFKREAEQLMPSIQSMLGVHVRFSDKKPSSSLEDLCAVLKERSEQIFLATDSLVVMEYLTKEIPSITYVPQRLHDGKSQGGLHHTMTPEDEKLIMFKNSLFDAYLLSQTKFFYGQSNSSFSLVVNAWRNGEHSTFWC